MVRWIWHDLEMFLFTGIHFHFKEWSLTVGKSDHHISAMLVVGGYL